MDCQGPSGLTDAIAARYATGDLAAFVQRANLHYSPRPRDFEVRNLWTCGPDHTLVPQVRIVTDKLRSRA